MKTSSIEVWQVKIKWCQLYITSGIKHRNKEMVPLRIEASLKKEQQVTKPRKAWCQCSWHWPEAVFSLALSWVTTKKNQTTSTCQSTTQKVSPKSTPNAPFYWLEPSSPSLPTIHPHHHLDKIVPAIEIKSRIHDILTHCDTSSYWKKYFFGWKNKYLSECGTDFLTLHVWTTCFLL